MPAFSWLPPEMPNCSVSSSSSTRVSMLAMLVADTDDDATIVEAHGRRDGKASAGRAPATSAVPGREAALHLRLPVVQGDALHIRDRLQPAHQLAPIRVAGEA